MSTSVPLFFILSRRLRKEVPILYQVLSTCIFGCLLFQVCHAFSAVDIETNLKTVSFGSLSECRLSGKVKLDKEEKTFGR